MRSASEHPWTYQNRWRISLAVFPDWRRWSRSPGPCVNSKLGANGRISIDYPRGPKTEGLDGGAEWIRTAGPAGFLIESRVLWQFLFLRWRRSALTEKEERMGSGLHSLKQAEPAVRIHSAPPDSLVYRVSSHLTFFRSTSHLQNFRCRCDSNSGLKIEIPA